MQRADLVAYCLAKPGAWADQPWENDTVIKVADKIFAFVGADDATTVGLKCGRDSEAAREWRDRYPGAVTVSAYIGRYGWNRLAIDAAISDEEIREAVDDSYADIVARLPKSKRP